MHAGLIAGPLALFADGAVHFLAGLFHHILNAGGVNPAVYDQLLQCQSGNLPADGIEAGDGNGLGGIVDDQVHAGDGLQSPDVPALPANDAALHLIVGQGHHGDGGLCGMIRRAALNGGGDDLPALFLGLVLQLLLDLLDLHSGLMADIVFNAVQQILLCLVLGQTGQLLQSLQLLLANLLGLGLGLGGIGQTRVQVLFLALKGFGLSVQGGFLLLKRAFLTSLSCSVRDLWISSLASSSISFFRFSPFRMASLIRRVASASAEPISRSATFFR